MRPHHHRRKRNRRKNLHDFLARWFPSLLTIAGALMAIFNDQLPNFAHDHPHWFIIAGAAWSILMHFAPSPIE